MKNFRSPSALVLVNLGTPQELTTSSIRSFLAEFLGDPRVVEIPRLLWWPLLHFLILPFRPRNLIRTYGSIWTEKGSPMRYLSESQVEKLQNSLDPSREKVSVKLAMTYGGPAIGDVLQELYDSGHRRIVVLPLYPQYSGSTTGAVYDQVARFVERRRALPGLSVINAYFYHPAFIQALCDSIEEFWLHNGRGDHLLFSYHGIPKRYVDLGDPYAGHCDCTTGATVDRLGLNQGAYSAAYQSRFGRAEWLKPYASERIVELAQSGVKKLDVVCPAFATDCLETLEEIAVENRDLFLANGGEELRLIPCLNDSRRHIEALKTIVEPYLQAFSSHD